MSNTRRDADARLATIRALLAKAEATPFPHEAEAFTAKASELMARHAIDEAMVWSHAAGADRAKPVEIRLDIHRPFLAQKAMLVHEVATIMGCKTVRFVGMRGDATEIISIVGFAPDLELVETLVTSLFLQLTAAMTGGSPSGLAASSVAAWRRSFIVGFSATVCRRLSEVRAAAAVEHEEQSSDGPDPTRNTQGRSRSTALVLVARADEVDDEFHRLHPRVRQVRVGVGSSPAGRRAGEHAGSRADLGSRRLSTQRALPA